MITAPKDSKKANNIYIYLMFMIFVVSIGMGLIPNIDQIGGFVELAMILSNCLMLLLLYLDREALKEKYPQEPIFSIFWVLIVPVYLFFRSRFLNDNQRFFIISIILFMMSVMTSSFVINYIKDQLAGPIIIEDVACQQVTDLLSSHPDDIKCDHVMIEKRYDEHKSLGRVHLSDGTYYDIIITAFNKGKFVYIENSEED